MKAVSLSGRFIGGGLAAILIFHALALYEHWYYAVWWLDVPMHILGGFWVALVFYYYLLKRSAGFAEMRPLELFVFTLATVSAVGVFWEFYEYFDDLLLKKGVELTARLGIGYADTLKDLADDLLGGTAAFLLLGSKILKKRM